MSLTEQRILHCHTWLKFAHLWTFARRAASTNKLSVPSPYQTTATEKKNPHEPFELFSHDSSFSGALLRGNYAVKGIPISRVNVVAGRESLIAHDDMVMDVFRALKNTKVSIFVRTFFSCPFCGLNLTFHCCSRRVRVADHARIAR